MEREGCEEARRGGIGIGNGLGGGVLCWFMSSYDTYTSPLAARNASEQMLRIWSPRHKFQTWRRIWLAVAEAQQACGLEITDEQVGELRAAVERGISDEEMKATEAYEKELRHDVMAHVHALGDVCPKAKPIIHLGCTSQDVVCNADLLILKDAWMLFEKKCRRAVLSLSDKADQLKTIATLGFTHYQAAQPVTVGRRCAGWAHDLDCALGNIGYGQTLRGFRGATGTQASFLSLFDGDHERVIEFESEALSRLIDHVPFTSICDEWYSDNRHRLALEAAVAEANDRPDLAERPKREAEELPEHPSEEFARNARAGYVEQSTFMLTGQTYPRVWDAHILAGLGCVAAVLHKIATDIRLLSNRKEIDEPFGDKQIGSSAMPYKRNPMRCERICGLTRFVMNLVGNAYDTAATQWLERTLDDSSNRRLSLPESFLALDGALDLMHNVASGLVVHEAMVTRNLVAELPFLATENILMAAVKAGGDRQDLHERIRVHSQAAGARVKDEGLDNDLIERLKGDEAFGPPALKHELDWTDLLDPMKYVGRSVEQTERFIREVIEPLRKKHGEALEELGASEPRV